MELIMEQANAAAVQLRAALNPYFFVLEGALHTTGSVLGGTSAIRRLQNPPPALTRDDYMLELWSGNPHADACSLAYALAQAGPRTCAPDLYVWEARDGSRISLGAYTLCSIRRVHRFKGTSILLHVRKIMGKGLFNAIDVPCLPATALLYQIYTILAEGNPPEGSNYPAQLALEFTIIQLINKNPPTYGITANINEISGSSDRKQDIKTSINLIIMNLAIKHEWPIIIKTPLPIFAPEDTKEAVEIIIKTLREKLHIKNVQNKQNPLLLPVKGDMPIKNTVYVELTHRFPVCEFYDTATRTPILISSKSKKDFLVHVSPFVILQHMAAEMWISEVLSTTASVPKEFISTRYKAAVNSIDTERAKLVINPCSAIVEYKWYGKFKPVIQKKRTHYGPSIFAIDIIKPPVATID